MKSIRTTALVSCLLLFGLALSACAGRLAGAAINPASEPAPALTNPPVGTATPGGSPVRVPILVYHHIALLKPTANADWRATTVSPAAFGEQMAYLKAQGFRAIHFADLIAHFDEGRTLPANPVIITFDDAWDDGYVAGLPTLKQFGLTATFFIPANWIGQVDGTLTWEQIDEMEASGMEIGSHTMTHPYLTKSNPDMLTWELENSKARLDKHLSQPVVALAYPFGLYDANVIAQARAAGYKAAVTLDRGVGASVENLMTLPRFMPGYALRLDEFAVRVSSK